MERERERQRERHREMRYARDAIETMASQIFLFDPPWTIKPDNITIVTMLYANAMQ
jgi:hypothetical protein